MEEKTDVLFANTPMSQQCLSESGRVEKYECQAREAGYIPRQRGIGVSSVGKNDLEHFKLQELCSPVAFELSSPFSSRLSFRLKGRSE